jgi:hypothetical protein
METIQAVVESKEIQVTAEQKSDQATAEIVRSLSAIELSAVGGGTSAIAFF